MVNRIAYHPGGRRLVSGDAAGVLKVWDVDRNQRALELSSTDDGKGVAFSADGGEVRVIRSSGFHGWNVVTGRTTIDHRVTLAQRAEWPLRFMALSPDGRFGADPDPQDPKDVRVWDVGAGKLLRTLKGHCTGVRSVAFSSDGRKLACAAGEKDAPVRELVVWQLPEPGGGAPVRTDFACESPIQSLAFSADGTQLIAGERGTHVPGTPFGKWVDGHVSVWEAATGRLLRRWPAHAGSVQSVAIDPAGRWIASGGRNDQSVCVWDADTGARRHELRGPASLTCVAFHPDGTRLAAVGYAGTVHLWDSATGQDILTLRGTDRHVFEGRAADVQVAFSPDGTRLTANSWNGCVYIWDARPLPER
jgi:WD40 repeat protein